MKRQYNIFFILFVIVTASFVFRGRFADEVISDTRDFRARGIIEESSSLGESADPSWWLDSGGLVYFKEGIGESINGNLPMFSKWRIKYYLSNPTDTDEGYHPQNILRLVSKGQWRNSSEQAYFYIEKMNFSNSPNRNASNGILIFQRYIDQNNLYYIGLRVDGAAVIKKKIGGVYHTLAYEPFFGEGYDRENNPNLLPEKKWIGLKSEIQTWPNNEVVILLWADVGESGEWKKILEARDSGVGGSAILESGHAGIRTDFMDIKFKNFRIEESPTGTSE